MPDFLKKLPPNQRRIAIAVAVGGLLALVVIIRRRSVGEPAAQEPTSQQAANYSSPIAGTDGGLPGSSTFADNGAAFGELNTTLTGVAGLLQTVLDTQSSPIPDTSTPSAPAEEAPTSQPPVVVNVSTVGNAKPGAGTGGKAAPKVVYSKGVRYEVDSKGKKTVAPTKAHPATPAKPAAAPKPAAKASKVVYSGGNRYTVSPTGKKTLAPTKAHPKKK